MNAFLRHHSGLAIVLTI